MAGMLIRHGRQYRHPDGRAQRRASAVRQRHSRRSSGEAGRRCSSDDFRPVPLFLFKEETTMLCEVPLNKEQQAFAADHHGLVYKFLNENRLPEDEFYDVIIFGYLRAVYRYFNEPKLQKYSFATISWKSMQGALSNYNRYQTRRKRNMDGKLFQPGIFIREWHIRC